MVEKPNSLNALFVEHEKRSIARHEKTDAAIAKNMAELTRAVNKLVEVQTDSRHLKERVKALDIQKDATMKTIHEISKKLYLVTAVLSGVAAIMLSAFGVIFSKLF